MCEMFCGLRTHIQDHLVIGHFINTANAVRSISRKSLGRHDIDGHRQFCTLLFKNLEHLAAFVHQIRFSERLADRTASCEQERIEDAAAHDKAIHFLGEIRENRELGRHL